jgi:hypothetical protein
MDPLLRPFVESTDEAEAARELDILIEQHALPLARTIAGRKLRAYRSEGPAASVARDREDVVGDTMVTLVQRLRAARESAEGAAIENLAGYTAAVVHSTCAHHIRRRYPARARLKNRLRYVFSTERRLALWTSDNDELVCGLSESSGARGDPAAERRLTGILEEDQQPWDTMSRRELTATIVDVLVSAGAPVDFEALVGAAVDAARVIEARETGDTDLAAASEPSPEVRIDQRRFLRRVWEEVSQLPLRQRIALLLNLRDPNGAGLLWLLPIAGVATMRQIARVLEIHDAELAGLWRDIPLDDATIGRRLGCTRQQVINLRMAARKRLVNRIGAAAPLSTEIRPREANLGPVSPSLKGSA